ncbi:MAG: DUF1499 domain-containing protein [Oligoflexus sp.]
MKKLGIWIGRGIGLVLSLLLVGLAAVIGIYQLTGHSFVAGHMPEGLGLSEAGLHPCPNLPLSRWHENSNCVSSLDVGTDYYIEPISFHSDVESEALQKIARAINEHPQIDVQVLTENYMHFEWSSQLFGFIDDVELWWRPELHRIEVRSAARLGNRDFGANRHHVAWLRAVLKEHRYEIMNEEVMD